MKNPEDPLLIGICSGSYGVLRVIVRMTSTMSGQAVLPCFAIGRYNRVVFGSAETAGAVS